MVTLPAFAGAVKVVVAPLSVLAGLKLDALHAVAGAQLQFTPMPAGSPVTVAAMVALVPVANDDGGGAVVLKATEITVALIAMAVLLAVALLLSTVVAVMVTALTGLEGAV